MSGTKDLQGQVAIVTGAGQGLGRAFAIHLAACGASVLVNNRRRDGSAVPDSADRVVEQIREEGGSALSNYEHVDHQGAGQRMVEQALDGFGRLDIVVANAGISSERMFHKISATHVREVMEINFFSSFDLTSAALPFMRKSGYGRLAYVISSAGLHGGAGLAAYSASKAAQVGMMKCIAKENEELDIKANALAPFAVSQMTATHIPPDWQEALTPERVAPVLGWLASPKCSISGEVIVSAAGAVRMAQTVETEGMILENWQSTDPEDLEARIDRIGDMTSSRSYPDATAAYFSIVNQATKADKP